MTHSWCHDIPRDEAVRAAEDGRQGPLPTLEEAISGVTERRPPEPGGGGNVTGLRTDRVTLEVTHDLDAPLGQWIVQVIDESLGFDEFVLVVEEAHFDDLAQVAMERDAAIQRADRDSVKCSALADKVISLRARVAELESAPAASGAAGTDVVAWGVMSSGGVLATSIHRTDTEDMRSKHACDTTVVPLYAAPQPASVWLTAEEREALTWWCGLAQPVDIDQLNAWCAAIRNLLARSSPPEVVLPGPWKDPGGPGHPQVSWQPFLDTVTSRRDAEWLAALAAEGA